MPLPKSTRRASKKTKASHRPQYHHGNLREALIAATVQLIEESGVEKVSVREAAKRVGVSSGAPFRHFRNRTALLTAVAEQTTKTLLAEVMRAVRESEGKAALDRFRAVGSGYMRWVINNPTQFKVVSDRELIDYENSPSLREDNEAMKSLMQRFLREAQQGGMLRAEALSTVLLTARALAYGVARMYVDGHLPQWGLGREEAERAFDLVFDLFVSGLASGATG